MSTLSCLSSGVRSAGQMPRKGTAVGESDGMGSVSRESGVKEVSGSAKVLLAADAFELAEHEVGGVVADRLGMALVDDLGFFAHALHFGVADFVDHHALGLQVGHAFIFLD